MICRFCGVNDVPDERVEIGYTHCKADECVGAWRRERIQDAGLRLVLLHKQGLAWVTEEDVQKNDIKRQGGVM